MTSRPDINRLLRACELGDESELRLLIESGHDVNSVDENETTPLQVAEFILASYLLHNGAKIDACNSTGCTALHITCFHGHNETIKVLLKSRASLTVRNSYHATPLHVAVASGHPSTVGLLLDAGAIVDEDSFQQCPSPVATASLYGYVSILRQILQSQKSSKVLRMVNSAHAETGWTPLMFAAAAGSKATVQCLIERGADPNVQNRLGQCAIEIAMGCDHSEVVAFLRDKTSQKLKTLEPKSSDIDELFAACKVGDVDTVSDLLTSRFMLDVNSVDSSGATPLMFASLIGSVDIIKKLLEKGAKVDVQDSVNGWTSLMQAVFYGHREAVRVLLEAGADPNIRAHNGFTSFDLATLVEETDSSLIKILADECVNSKSVNDLENSQGKGLRAWWAKVGKRFRSLSNTEFENSSIDERPNGNLEIIRDVNSTRTDIGKLSTSDLTRTFSKSRHTVSLCSAHQPKFGTDFVRVAKLPEGISPADCNKFLPLVDTRALLRKYVDKSSTKDIIEISKRHSQSAGTTRNGLKVNGRVKSAEKSKVSLRATSFSDFRPRTKSPIHDRRTRRRDERDVKKILEHLSLQKYIQVFQNHEIDFDAFVELSDEDLVEIGVTKPLARKKILEEIKKFN